MPDFSGSADKLEAFQIKSLILDAGWIEKEGAVGATVTLQVRTVYVGHGAPISITLKNWEGKTLQKIDGVVYADLFRKKILLAKEAAGGVFFEAELSKHSLKVTGQKLHVKPLVRVYEPTWKSGGKAVSKVMRDMDLLVEAKTENIADGAEAKIFFKEKLSDTLIKDLAVVPCQVKDKKISLTWRFEYPKDTAAISSTEEKKKTAEQYKQPKVFFEAWSEGVTAKGPEVDFVDGVTIEVVDGEDKPLPKRKVKITLPDGTVKEMESDDLGMVVVEEAAPGKVLVELLPEPKEEKKEPKPAAEGQGGAGAPSSASAPAEKSTV